MDLTVLLTFVVLLVLSVFSGMAGGGAGMIVIPYFIAIGLPPASALATARTGGLGTAIGSLGAFKGKGLVNRKYVGKFIWISLIAAVIASFIIPRIDAEIFQKIIGVILLIMIPTLFIRRKSFQPGKRPKSWIVGGFIAFIFFSFAQALFGTGIGMIINLVLMYGFGMDVLQANATKRTSQAVVAVVSFTLLALQGLVVWSHAIAGLIAAIIGTYIGTKLAIKEGPRFVKFAMAAFMVMSGTALLFS